MKMECNTTQWREVGGGERLSLKVQIGVANWFGLTLYNVQCTLLGLTKLWYGLIWYGWVCMVWYGLIGGGGERVQIARRIASLLYSPTSLFQHFQHSATSLFQHQNLQQWKWKCEFLPYYTQSWQHLFLNTCNKTRWCWSKYEAILKCCCWFQVQYFNFRSFSQLISSTTKLGDAIAFLFPSTIFICCILSGLIFNCILSNFFGINLPFLEGCWYLKENK